MKTIIGTMSGTSMDGVDVALLTTDGEGVLKPGATYMRPYTNAERKTIRGAMEAAAQTKGKTDGLNSAEEAASLITKAHAEAIKTFMEENSLSSKDISLAAFHGQTIYHAPVDGITLQIGHADTLAKEIGISVVHDFRSNDVRNGGEGAPLVPVFHKALLQEAGINDPAAVVNIGGIANMTYVDGDTLSAHDTGPGNALIDDWMASRTSKKMDIWGRIAGEGSVNEAALEKLMSHPYFKMPTPKSLDRDAFSILDVDHCALAEGVATLTAFTAHTIANAVKATNAKRLFICGGGASNRTMMKMLEAAGGIAPEPVTNLKEEWDGDFLEAYAFAYLAARSEKGLPISFPETTGVRKAMIGGTMSGL